MMTREKHIEAIAALSLLHDGKEEALSLVDYMAAGDGPALKTILEKLSEVSLEEHLTALRSGDDFSGLAEIHPAWLCEVLKKESPRVVGVVLRHLPSKHVRYLLEHLPKRLCMELPKLIEAFYVPNELLDILRRRVERHFVPLRISHEISRFSFEHLYYLRIEELEKLFIDLGLSELALSLIGSSKQIVKIILNRFSVQEAKEAFRRIKSFQTEPRWFVKDAKYSVLESGDEEMGASRFLNELGLMAAAKAIARGEEGLLQALCQKMEPAAAYLLKRLWGECHTASNADKWSKRQGWILEHVKQLSSTGKIDAFWSDCFAEERAA